MADTPAFDKAKLAWTLPWQEDWVTSVCFIPGTRKVAAGNRRGGIFLWELPEQPGGETPSPVRKLDGHTNEVTRLVATPDGRWLISASYDHTIRFWDLEAKPTETAEVILDARTRAEAAKKLGKNAPPPAPGVKVEVQKAERVLEAHKEWILGLALTPDGKTLVSGDDAGQVIMWDRAEAKELRRWKVKGWVWALAISPDAQMVAASERFTLVFTPADHHVGMKLWDATTGQVKHDLSKDYKMYIGAAAFSPDGKLVALAQGYESDGKLFLVESATGKKVRELPGHRPGGAHDVQFSADGKYLLSCGRDTMVRVWNVEDGKEVAQLSKARGGQFKDIFHALSISTDQHWIAAADMAGQVQVFSA
jgi:WD40 repeat protein